MQALKLVFDKAGKENAKLSKMMLQLVRHKHNNSYYSVNEKAFQLRRALIVAKLSRLEFEQLRYPALNSDELERKIRDRGTDYDSLINYNDLHVEFKKRVMESFKESGVEVRVVDR